VDDSAWGARLGGPLALSCGLRSPPAEPVACRRAGAADGAFGPAFGVWYPLGMGFRFSMKWLLAGMVYVALTAAALTQPGWAWADALWVVSFLAICYAGLLAIYAAGARRARAVGFLTGSLALVAAMHFAPQSVPVGRIVEALAPANVLTATPTSQLPVVYPTYSAPASGGFRGQTVVAPLYQSQAAYQSGYYVPVSVLNPQADRTRAGGALAVMLAGFEGSLLGALAHRQCRTAAGSGNGGAGGIVT
jgi:hypothetical protein